MRSFQFVVFLFFFSGCLSSYQYTVPLAPDYYIAPRDRKILIGHISSDSILSKSILPFDSLRALSVKGATEKLLQLSRVDVILLDSISNKISYPLSSPMVDSLFNLSGATSLLLLTEMDLSTESSYGIYKNELGRVVSGDGFYFELNTQWKMYFRRDATFEDFSHFEDTYYDSYNNTYVPQPLEVTTQRIISEISALASLSGQNLALRFLPYQEAFQAYLFELEPLREANYLLRQGKKEEARKAYIHVAEFSNKRIAAKAYYNMAISYEANQDYDQAIVWAKKAEQLLPSHHLIIELNQGLIARKKEFDTWKNLRD